MTFLDLKNQVAIGFNRQDLESSYGSAVNSACRYIQHKKSFTWMRHFDTVGIAIGSASGKLFDDFKELTRGTSPITWTSDLINGREIPCLILQKNELKRLSGGSIYYTFNLDPSTFSLSGRIPVWVDYDSGRPTLNIPRPLNSTDATVTFNVNYYRFLPELAEDDDDNELTRNFPEMVVNKAKAILFELVNDDQAAKSEAIFMNYFKEASAYDSYREVAGVRNLM